MNGCLSGSSSDRMCTGVGFPLYERRQMWAVFSHVLTKPRRSTTVGSCRTVDLYFSCSGPLYVDLVIVGWWIDRAIFALEVHPKESRCCVCRATQRAHMYRRERLWKLSEPLIVMAIVIGRCGDTTRAVGSQGWLLSPSSGPRFGDTS